MDLRGFQRGGDLSASARGYVDIGWAGLVFDQRSAELHAHAVARLEQWRSRP